jgi:hypothetical protein
MPHCNMQCCNCERKSQPEQNSSRSTGGKRNCQWMMTAAARSEKLPIRLIADAPRNIRSNLGRLAAGACGFVMDWERGVSSNDASFETLFLITQTEDEKCVQW